MHLTTSYIVAKFQLPSYDTFGVMNYCLVWFLVQSRRTDGRTESDAYEPTCKLYRWAQWSNLTLLWAHLPLVSLPLVLLFDLDLWSSPTWHLTLIFVTFTLYATYGMHYAKSSEMRFWHRDLYLWPTTLTFDLESWDLWLWPVRPLTSRHSKKVFERAWPHMKEDARAWPHMKEDATMELYKSLMCGDDEREILIGWKILGS